jgi:hypothetical protein
VTRTSKAGRIATFTVVLTLMGVGPYAGTTRAFEVDVHESIDAAALSFLRPGVYDDLVDEHSDWADAFTGDAKDVGWVHADNCAFGETAEQINSFHSQAITNLTPGSNFDPWSATDDFGRLFHPVQDFYSHSNWVELGYPANDDPGTPRVEVSAEDLVDFGTRLAGSNGLGEWSTPGPKGIVREVPAERGGDILLDDMVVTPLKDTGKGFLERDESQFTVVHDLEPNWNVGLLPDPADPTKASHVPGIDTTGDATFSYLDGAIPDLFDIPVMTSGGDKRFLLSGVGARPAESVVENQCDPYTRDFEGNRVQPLQVNRCLAGILRDYFSCISYFGSRFALAHGGDDGSGVNKDSPDESPELHPKAKALAVLQSKYEWCRFVNLASLSGADGIALSLWVAEDGSPAVNPAGTPCASDGGGGPKGVTVTIDKVTVLNDHDPGAGEINLSLAVYDSPSEFHRLKKEKSGPVDANDGDASKGLTGPEVPKPVTQCVFRADSTFRVALHGWDDDDTVGGGDFGDNVASADEALVGFTETLSADLSIGGSDPHHATSSNLAVDYTVTRAPDTDGDGLDECGETWYGTDPANADTDGDGLPDGIEVLGANPTDPNVKDTDDDQLWDGTEDANHNGAVDTGETDPNKADSDNDGLKDGIEVLGTNPTNPLVADTDGDGLKDGVEDANKNGAFDLGETNPNDADTDDDLLKDGQEVTVGTDSLDSDSDDDGIIDGKDVDWIQSAITAIPTSALAKGDPGLRTSMNSLLDNAEKRIARGDKAGALSTLDTLRKRMDGCGSRSDRNDWIVDCTVQTRIRALVDIVIANNT